MPAGRFPDLPGVQPVPPRADDACGLVGLGGRLTPDLLLSAYRQGVFAWSGERPLPWCCPDPRALLLPGGFHASRSLHKTRRRGRLTLTQDTAFGEVLEHCALCFREGQDGTWITPNLVRCFEKLHALGHAHSVEVWCEGELCGGLYGLVLRGPGGSVFCGESMFSYEPDASKLALWSVAEAGHAWIDCQAMTPHLRTLGAVPVPRAEYLERLAALLGTVRP